MSRCKRCGGSLVVDDGEVKCMACGWSPEGAVIDVSKAREEVEQAAVADWDAYVVSRRESLLSRYGKSSPESIAEYKSRYYFAHREKSIDDALRWKRSHKAHLREYRRRRGMFSDFGVCSVCGKSIHFSQKSGWTHYRKDRAFHLAECFRG